MEEPSERCPTCNDTINDRRNKYVRFHCTDPWHHQETER